MKILITGGCGFIGSSLAIFLKKKIKTAQITSIDNLSKSSPVDMGVSMFICYIIPIFS